jgi:hypothetical protein
MQTEQNSNIEIPQDNPNLIQSQPINVTEFN